MLACMNTYATRTHRRRFLAATASALALAHTLTNTPETEASTIVTWGAEGDGPGEFQSPIGVAIAPDGTILVLDAGDGRVQRLAPDGSPLGSFGSLGSGPGQFDRPSGIAVDADGAAAAVQRDADHRSHVRVEKARRLQQALLFRRVMNQHHVPCRQRLADDRGTRKLGDG